MCSRAKTNSRAKTKKSFTLLYVLMVVLASLFYSCTELEPVFASIENEEIIRTSNLPDKVTTLGMVRIGDLYVISTGGALYRRKVDGENWTVIPLPDGHQGVGDIVSLDPLASYVILIKDYHVNIGDTALFQINGDASTDTQLTFTSVQTVSKADGVLSRIFIIEGQDNVFANVSKQEDGAALIDYYQNYQTASPQLIESDRNDYTTGFVDLNGVTYVSTQSQLFELSAGSLNMVDVKTAEDNLTGLIGGAYVSLANELYLSAQDSIWKYDATTWTVATHPNIQFTRFIEIDEVGFAGILVGTRFIPGSVLTNSFGSDDGYRELAGGDIAEIAIPAGNKYSSGNLNMAGVLGFFHDDILDTLFVFTSSQGLWRGSYVASRDVDWFLE